MKVKVRDHTREKGKIHVRDHTRTISIPSNWRNIKKFKHGPILARGIDPKGRFQYIYSEKETEKNGKDKYTRIDKLEKNIDKIMPKIEKDADNGKQEAQAIYLMYKTGFRPGTEKDTHHEKPAYGTLTLKKNHIKVKPGNITEFDFPAKWNVRIHKEFKDKKLADIIKDGLKKDKIFDTNATNTRRYFQKVTDGKYKMKDFRTLKAQEIAEEVCKKEKDPAIVKQVVAKNLGNTPKIASASYISPRFLE